MKRVCHLWPEEPSLRGDWIEVSAVLEGTRGGSRRIFFRLPAEERPNLTRSADPFLIATTFHVMRAHADLEVHGTVSPSLLAGLEEFQLAWSRWRPDRYRPVSFKAEIEREQEREASGRTVMTFSGGLDSCCTAWRHTRGDSGRRKRRLETAVMVHGFDIPLEQDETFSRAAASSRAMLDSIGVSFLPVICNIRDLKDSWYDAHGAALIACLHLLAGNHSIGLVASSHHYDDLRLPWGSNPVTDPLLGSASLSIVHDGCDLTRLDKADQIGEWDEALQHLRVCWEGEHLDRNCGHCIRCTATALCFAAIGRPIPPAIPVSSPSVAVERLDARKPNSVQLGHLERKVLAARANGIDEPWVSALARLSHTHRQRRRLLDGFAAGLRRMKRLGFARRTGRSVWRA
jgi:hypothetical protein